MAYCTLDDLKAANISEREMIQLTDDEGIGEINSGRIDRAIKTADDKIESFLRGRYTLPLNPVPGEINAAAVALTIYYLFLRSRKREIPDIIQARFDEAKETLKNLQSGKQRLGVETPAPEKRVYKTNKTSEDRVFSKDVLDTF